MKPEKEKPASEDEDEGPSYLDALALVHMQEEAVFRAAGQSYVRDVDFEVDEEERELAEESESDRTLSYDDEDTATEYEDTETEVEDIDDLLQAFEQEMAQADYAHYGNPRYIYEN